MMEARAVSKIISLTAAGTKTLYTCPSNCRAKVPLVYIVNANGTNTVQLKWYRKEENLSFFIVGGKNLSFGEAIQLSDGYIVLEAGDRLDVTVSSSGIVDALCTAEETFTANINRA
jgi:hypothetical protein